MTDVAAVQNGVVNPKEEPFTQRSEPRLSPGIKIVTRFFSAASRKTGWAQTILFFVGIGLAIPLIGLDVAIMVGTGLIWLNKQSRRLAWLVEKSGVLFPAMGFAMVVSVLTFTVAPAKEIRTEIIKTIQANPAPAVPADDGGAEGN